MNSGETSNDQISPEQIQVAVESEFKKHRPKWAKLAGARFLHILFPKLTAGQWVTCFESTDPIHTMLSIVDLPWFVGRLSRWLPEMRKLDHGSFAFLQRMKWLQEFGIRSNEGNTQPDQIIEGMILFLMQKALQQESGEQLKFWRSFVKGFERGITPRPQDVKALGVYLFLALNWQEAERCTSIRQLYELIFRKIPQEPCPQGVDPIDFEDRQVKWFEQLCQRNLGLSLAKRGRPKNQKKIPQSS